MLPASHCHQHRAKDPWARLRPRVRNWGAAGRRASPQRRKQRGGPTSGRGARDGFPSPRWSPPPGKGAHSQQARVARTSRAHVPWSLECALKPDLRALLKKPLCPSTRPSPTAPSASPRPQTLLLLFGCLLASRSRAGVRRHAEGPRSRGAGWERALWGGPRGLQPRPGPCPRRARSAQAGDRGVGSLTPPRSPARRPLAPPLPVPWSSGAARLAPRPPVLPRSFGPRGSGPPPPSPRLAPAFPPGRYFI